MNNFIPFEPRSKEPVRREHDHIAHALPHSEHWKWLPGMRKLYWAPEDPINHLRPATPTINPERLVPDLEDDQTVLLVLLLLRQALGSPSLYCTQDGFTGRWGVWKWDDPNRALYGTHKTEAAALGIALLEASK